MIAMQSDFKICNRTVLPKCDHDDMLGVRGGLGGGQSCRGRYSCCHQKVHIQGFWCFHEMSFYPFCFQFILLELYNKVVQGRNSHQRFKQCCISCVKLVCISSKATNGQNPRSKPQTTNVMQLINHFWEFQPFCVVASPKIKSRIYEKKDTQPFNLSCIDK